MGVSVETVRAGDGKLFPHEGQTVSVHYVARLAATGEQFDSTLPHPDGRGHAFKFKLEAGQVVKGWDLAVAQLSLGEKAIVKMSSDVAWGEEGIRGLIPPNADLEFDVELVGIQ